jgi:branched-chain amino acid transport system ATP-binding protein
LSFLTVNNIHASYGSSRALFGVSLEMREGECVCLLGRNGVGKTTTMRAIMGLTPPSQGEVIWKGSDIAGLPSFRIARAGIGFVPEDRRIFAELSVRDNLEVASQAAGRTGRWTI